MVKLLIRKPMHVGALRRGLRAGAVVEYDENTGIVKIDGQVVHPKSIIDGGEAVRSLVRMAEAKPEDPCVQIVEVETLQEKVALEYAEGELESEEDSGVASDVLCVLPVLGCLKAFKEFTEAKAGNGQEVLFRPVNEKQTDFLDYYGDLADDDMPAELFSIADEDAEVVQAFLKGFGFDIRLQGGDGVHLGSVLDVLLKWVQSGVKTVIRTKAGKEYPGFKLSHGVVVSEDKSLHPYPVIRVNTKSGDQVCISPVAEDGDLFLMVDELRRVRQMSHSFEGVCLPSVDMEGDIDLSWLKGFGMSGLQVSEAIQKFRFKMNEEGARAQSAVGMSVKRGLPPPPYVVNRPFLLWIEREGMGVPLFAAVIGEEYWKEPASL